MNEQQIARLLVEALAGRGDIIVGQGSGVRPDGTVFVTDGRRSVKAIAVSGTGTGAIAAVRAANGKWYAIAVNSSVVQKNTTAYSRHYSQTKKLNKCSIKVLFSVFEGDVQKFYIGGDRPQPLLIFEIDTTIFDGDWYSPGEYPGGYTYDPATGIYSYHRPYINGYISNTGTKFNDWVVGIRFYKTTNTRFGLPNAGISDRDDVYHLAIIKPLLSSSSTSNTILGVSFPTSIVYVQIYSDINTTGIGNLEWKGGGLWASNMNKMMYISQWQYYYEVGYTETQKHFQEAYLGNAPASITAINPDQWDFNTNLDPPFSTVQSYSFNDYDHSGIRNLVNTVTFDSSENYSYQMQAGNNVYYEPPPSAFVDYPISNPSTRWSFSVNPYKNYPYSWDFYTAHDNCEYVHRCSMGTTDNNSYQISTDVFSAEQYHWEADGGRKYLLITPDGVKHQFDYNYKATESYCDANRPRSAGLYLYTRHLIIFDSSGISYLLPNKYVTGQAYSKITMDDTTIVYNNIILQGSTLDGRPIYGKPSQNKRSYEETVAAASNLKSCFFKQVSIDRIEATTFPDYDEIVPDSVKYFIYNGSTAVEINGIPPGFDFDHSLNTFINNSGFKRVYLDSMPIAIKTNTVNITPKVEKYFLNAGRYNILNQSHKPVQVFSLKIDLNKKNFIHNLSYYSGAT